MVDLVYGENSRFLLILAHSSYQFGALNDRVVGCRAGKVLNKMITLERFTEKFPSFFTTLSTTIECYWCFMISVIVIWVLGVASNCKWVLFKSCWYLTTDVYIQCSGYSIEAVRGKTKSTDFICTWNIACGCSYLVFWQWQWNWKEKLFLCGSGKESCSFLLHLIYIRRFILNLQCHHGIERPCPMLINSMILKKSVFILSLVLFYPQTGSITASSINN